MDKSFKINLSLSIKITIVLDSEQSEKCIYFTMASLIYYPTLMHRKKLLQSSTLRAILGIKFDILVL